MVAAEEATYGQVLTSFTATEYALIPTMAGAFYGFMRLQSMLLCTLRLSSSSALMVCACKQWRCALVSFIDTPCSLLLYRSLARSASSCVSWAKTRWISQDVCDVGTGRNLQHQCGCARL